MSTLETSNKVVPQFEHLVGRSGIHIHDPVEDVQVLFFTDRQVSPRTAETDQFVFPVGSAVEISVSRLEAPFLFDIWIRDMDGETIEEFTPSKGQIDITRGDYLLEFTGLGMKLYACVTGSGFSVDPDEDSLTIDFDEETTVVLGARSFHSQPGRTLTTTSEPTDLMQAISLFGNAMKTWSPERTFPSLRGHPPLLELGSECQIPSGLSPPDTDIELTIPAEHSWLYPAVPLAYWLGATVREGSPALYVDGNRYPLGTDNEYDADSDREAYEQHVQDILQFTFFLDCSVRADGFYDVELDARRRVEAIGLPLDFNRLYQMPLAERVNEYLELDCTFSSLADRVGRPGWRLTADVDPEPERATTLPFLARDLAVIRCPSPSKLERSSEEITSDFEDVFERTNRPQRGHSAPTGPLMTRASSSPDSSQDSEKRERIIGLPSVDSMSHAWIGDGFAIGAAKASTQSYLQRLEKHAEGDSGISIDVVMNDEEMDDEVTVSDIYGTRDHLAFDIGVHRNLSTEALAEVFESDTDFVHYIGHVDPEGFNCHDGYLDAEQLGSVGADTFILNACTSYEQGQHLVDKGAIAGVVTLEDVINSLATKVGKTVARLLNYGFPIGSATGLIQETIFTGSNYVVVGDSNAAVTQSNVAVPNVARVSLRGDGRFDVSIETFASWNYDVGSAYRPFIEGCDCHYVVPGELDTWRVDEGDLDDFFDRYMIPVIGGDNLFWSDEITAATLRERFESYV